MKTLFFCNTNYQLIAAIQITQSLKKNASVIITNQIINADKIYERLNCESIFEIIVILDVKTKLRTSTILKRCVSGWLPNNIKGIRFDEFVGFNMDIPSHYVYAGLYHKNKAIVVNKMEEGLLSYNTLDTNCKVLTIAWIIRKLVHKDNLREVIRSFYCFQPEAYFGKLQPVPIPPIITSSNVVNILKRVFGSEGISNYHEKYIFFTSVYDFEGGQPVGEYFLACKVRELIGNDNLLIKKHPRDVRTIYEDAGFHVDKKSLMPWEVVQLSRDFSEHIFLTVNSGSVLSGSLLSNKPVKTYYLFRCCDVLKNNAAIESSKNIIELLNNNKIKFAFKNIQIAENIDEIIE